ncbi:MAG: hypothetical protein HYV28_02370 [Ignavibacteriales bacterium]|nr:hypothetical protein [Ignavibacteriales bacterium]
MNKELITAAFLIAMIILYGLILLDRKHESSDSRLEKLIEAMKEYSKEHPDFKKILSKVGLL